MSAHPFDMADATLRLSVDPDEELQERLDRADRLQDFTPSPQGVRPQRPRLTSPSPESPASDNDSINSPESVGGSTGLGRTLRGGLR